MISVVIVTFNEAEKIKDCLKSVQGFCDEIVVVDLGSKDEIKVVAKEYGAQLFYHKQVSFVELVRDYAISLARGEWILILDPDERITNQLKLQLKQVTQHKEYAAVNIPRKNIFFGKWISHTNFWPDRQIRFFKKGSVNWPRRIHAYPVVFGEILNLPSKEELAIIHYGYDNFPSFWERQKRYAQVEAENRFKDGERAGLKHFVLLPAREFLVRFIKHKGFLDGIPGMFIAFTLMYYKVVMAINMQEVQLKK